MVLFDRAESKREDSSSGLIYSKLLMSMHVERKASNYLWNMMFPNFLISSSVLASYGIPAAEFSGRLQVTVTILLALTSTRALR